MRWTIKAHYSCEAALAAEQLLVRAASHYWIRVLGLKTVDQASGFQGRIGENGGQDKVIMPDDKVQRSG